jgi:hypothetical protein
MNKLAVQRFFKDKRVISFTASLLVVFLFLLAANIRAVRWDGAYYVHLSNSFAPGGKFSFYNFPEAYRGYFFPFCLLVCRGLALKVFGDAFMGIWFFNATILAATSCLLLPKLMELVTGKADRPMVYYFLPALLTVLFWCGPIFYPDSDLAAIFFLLIAIVFIYMGASAPLIATKRIKLKGVFLYFVAGFFAYGAYNTRTIYLFSGLGLALIYIFLCYQRKAGAFEVVLSLFVIALGVAAASCPQYIINMNTRGVSSIAVITTYGGNTSLFVNQLSEGIKYWLYETYDGPSSVYPVVGVNFFDPIRETYIIPRADSISDYVKLAFSHPWEFVGIYFRHFIAALNPVFGEGYIYDLQKPKVALIFTNSLLMFVTALGFVAGFGQKAEKPGYYRKTFAKYLPFYPLLLPCLAILPSAMEIRFLLPCYIIMYGLLAYAFDYKKIARIVRNRPVTCAAAFVLLFVFLLSTYQTLWAATQYDISIYPMR